MTGRLEGKVAFITGAGRGQGRSHAIRLAQEGVDIIAIDICEDIGGVPYPMASEDDLATTVKEVEALDRRIIATKADVRDLTAVRAAVDAGVAEFGRLDIVSANAGISTSPHLSHELSEELWKNLVDINLTGVWRTTTATIPHLIAGGRGGSIILTSSAAGLVAYENISQYVSAKHGVVGLMKTLALELAPHSIRVNSLHPTQVDTPMIQNQVTYDLFVGKQGATEDEFATASGVYIPLPIPWVEPIDVSNAVVFLASDEARYITGVALPVDGGATLK